MALTFEYTVDLSTQALEPIAVEQSFITNEPTGELINYFMNEGTAAEKVQPYTGPLDYTDINFVEMTRRLTTLDVSRIGIKTFPAIGSYGFYKSSHDGLSKVLVPINVQSERLTAPTLAMSHTTTTVNFTIVAPTDVTYKCYRIVLVLGHFAYEYVTYETSFSCPMPAVKGEYTVYCIGYVGEGAYVSDISNTLTLTVTTGKDSFGPDRSTSYYTKEEIDAIIGQIGTVLDNINGVVI